MYENFAENVRMLQNETSYQLLVGNSTEQQDQLPKRAPIFIAVKCF